ncbi:MULTISPECIES: TonB-dependent receptor [Bacteroides]|uniref:SusC/RagA family TonB-linked outer membrane protein n=1 Tax=Bacteroides TaxID=816 RepID=UPI000E4517E1|nr:MULTISPECIES: TonB-dependent receptor [Bacteroides]MBS7575340.1 TonB-dependent receptor [Bacteroides propionicigenes]RGM30125.1 TonB-dependent receptor [Bacteroides sp. OM08-17BH]HBO06244.1 SusC/RagA family protein [Bacteroides sp.]
MENIRKILLLTSCLFITLGMYAQSITVTGKVIDEEGLEVIGANISVKGSAGVGTITNLDGQYTLKVNNPSKDILVFSFIGMRTQEVHVKGKKQINVTLQSDSKLLDEVVVIGYGTSKRSDLTGSVVSVKSEDLMQTPTSDVAQALAGRVAGVQISQSEGGPGSSISINVRGGISMTQSNEPLYVIDGYPSEDGMSSLDPGEIESIDILKDASSTAIYGARGANGVVVITTKKGPKDASKMNVSFDSYVGISKIAKKLDVLSPAEFALLDYERSYALNGTTGVSTFQKRYGSFQDIDENYADRKGIDWQEEALGRVTTSQNYRVNISGGTKELKYGMSYNYFKEQGAMVYSGDYRHNISFNISHKASSRFQANARFSYNQGKTYGMGTSGQTTRFNKMEHILQYRPISGIKGSDTELLEGEDPMFVDQQDNPMQNPIISAREEDRTRFTRNLQANGGFTFYFSKKLSFRNIIGTRYYLNRNDQFNGDLSAYAKRSSIGGYIQYAESNSFQTSNVLTFDNRYKKAHRFTLMLGQEWISSWSKSLRADANQFANDDLGLNNMGAGVPTAISSSYINSNRMISWFTRANYNFKNKYLFTATLRADGSSKFGHNHKWGVFPSVSGAWRMSEEPFIKKLNLFSDLKLRVGYGLAGNNRIGDFMSLDLLNSIKYANGSDIITGYIPSSIPSVDLQWEANKTLNMGLDVGFLAQRIIITPEFYLNRSNHLLLNSRVPSSSGFTKMMRNIGETQNIGFDLAISTFNIQRKQFSWKTDFNISYNKNTIRALSGEDYFYEEYAFGWQQSTHKVEVGKAIGQFYGYKTLGLYQVDEFDYNPDTQKYTLKEGIPYKGSDRNSVRPGDWKFANIDDTGDSKGVVNEKDKTVIGNANPDFYGGINNTFKYKNFDLSIFFRFSYGGEVLNATKLSNTQSGKLNYNVLDICNMNNRWTYIDRQTGKLITDPEQLKAVNTGRTIASIYDMEQGDKYIHSWAVEDASFLRLQNVSLGYNFPKQLIRKYSIQRLRLYFTANNLFVWTPYSGFDPETSVSGSGLTRGIDFGSYPRNRSFVFGLNLTL